MLPAGLVLLRPVLPRDLGGNIIGSYEQMDPSMMCAMLTLLQQHVSAQGQEDVAAARRGCHQERIRGRVANLCRVQ